MDLRHMMLQRRGGFLQTYTPQVAELTVLLRSDQLYLPLLVTTSSPRCQP